MLRLGLVCDFPEERWPSMDLCAEMLLTHLPDGSVAVERLVPSFRRCFGGIPVISRVGAAGNADRLLNRFVRFPHYLRRQSNRCDVFHIVDHSYAQLVHVLPPERTGVFCHDLDAFRCLLDPRQEPRPRWFRAQSRRVLSGLQKAAVVFYSTQAVRAAIVRHALLDVVRLIRAPYGVAAEFTADGPAAKEPAPFLLHVGSNIPRKRIDILLRTLSGVREHFPTVRLVKVGGPFTRQQEALISELGLSDAVSRHEGLQREQIAALYRSAAAVLLPSDSEGFGLPVIEALACGAPVLASDLAVLREVGGAAAVYVPAGDVAAWVNAVAEALVSPDTLTPRPMRIAQAAKFTWANHAAIIRGAYLRLVR